MIGIPGSLLFATGQESSGYFTQDTETTTFFGQVDINITDNLSAVLGASYIEDEKEVTGLNVNTDIFSNLGFVGIGTLGLIQAGVDPATAAVLATNPQFNPLLGFQALQFLPEMQAFPNAGQSGKSSDDNVDYTAKLTYALNENTSYMEAFLQGLNLLHGIFL